MKAAKEFFLAGDLNPGKMIRSRHRSPLVQLSTETLVLLLLDNRRLGQREVCEIANIENREISASTAWMAVFATFDLDEIFYLCLPELAAGVNRIKKLVFEKLRILQKIKIERIDFSKIFSHG